MAALAHNPMPEPVGNVPVSDIRVGDEIYKAGDQHRGRIHGVVESVGRVNVKYKASYMVTRETPDGIMHGLMVRKTDLVDGLLGRNGQAYRLVWGKENPHYHPDVDLGLKLLGKWPLAQASAKAAALLQRGVQARVRRHGLSQEYEVWVPRGERRTGNPHYSRRWGHMIPGDRSLALRVKLAERELARAEREERRIWNAVGEEGTDSPEWQAARERSNKAHAELRAANVSFEESVETDEDAGYRLWTPRREKGTGNPDDTKLPERTSDTMSEAIALSSPSGRMSKRARKAAEQRLSKALFGEHGIPRSFPKQPSRRESLLQQATRLRELAGRGMSVRKYTKEAARLEAEAVELGAGNPGPFNKQGRAVSESMRLREFKQFLKTQPKQKDYNRVEYQGQVIEGRGNKWYIVSGNDPRIFSSEAKAKEAVDAMLALRAELGGGNPRRSTLVDQLMDEVIVVSGWPQHMARRGVLAQAFQDMGYTRLQIEYMVWNKQALPLPPTVETVEEVKALFGEEQQPLNVRLVSRLDKYRKSNPSPEWKRLTSALARRPDVTDPEALAAWIEDRKYGRGWRRGSRNPTLTPEQFEREVQQAAEATAAGRVRPQQWHGYIRRYERRLAEHREWLRAHGYEDDDGHAERLKDNIEFWKAILMRTAELKKGKGSRTGNPVRLVAQQELNLLKAAQDVDHYPVLYPIRKWSQAEAASARLAAQHQIPYDEFMTTTGYGVAPHYYIDKIRGIASQAPAACGQGAGQGALAACKVFWRELKREHY